MCEPHSQYLLAGHKPDLFHQAIRFVDPLTLSEPMFKPSLATNSIPGVAVECWRDVRIVCPSSYVSGSWNAPILPCSLRGRVVPAFFPQPRLRFLGLEHQKPCSMYTSNNSLKPRSV